LVLSVAFLLACASFVVPSICRAQWVPNGVGVCTADRDQLHPAITSDNAGGAIVTWEDDRRGGGNTIYAQRINASGSVQWVPNGVPCGQSFGQHNPVLVPDGTGGAIVAWVDYRHSYALDIHIYAQRISASGTVLWAPNGVDLCPGILTDQEDVVIASDGAGGAIVAWVDSRNGFGIFAQRINAAGVIQWGANGVALCPAAEGQFYPSIVSDSAGGAIVTWLDRRSGNYYDIYAQRVRGSGAIEWPSAGVALSVVAKTQWPAKIIPDGAGGAITAWIDYRFDIIHNGDDPADTRVYLQRIDASGATRWVPNGIPVSTAAGSQYSPELVSDNAGGGIVVFLTGPQIAAQRIDASGAARWAPNGVTLCASNVGVPVAASDGAGGAIVTWTSYRYFNDISAQRITAAGVVQFPRNGLILCNALYDQVEPVITADGAGAAIVAWRDERNILSASKRDIYAQRLDSSAYPIDTTPPEIMVSLNRDVLWPPNQKLVEVCATVKVTDSVDPAPTFVLLSITSDEPSSGKGNGNSSDIRGATIGTADLCYDLRAERSGGGSGREYQIIYQAKDASNNVAYDTVSVRVPANASLLAENGAPYVTALLSVHPNPFNPETAVDYSLERTQRVVISIYDVKGALVRRLVDQLMSAGEHRAAWSGVDDAGRPASSGIYFVRMIAGSYTETRKIVMLK
jgi:hypothetical protein